MNLWKRARFPTLVPYLFIVYILLSEHAIISRALIAPNGATTAGSSATTLGRPVSTAPSPLVSDASADTTTSSSTTAEEDDPNANLNLNENAETTRHTHSTTSRILTSTADGARTTQASVEERSNIPPPLATDATDTTPAFDTSNYVTPYFDPDATTNIDIVGIDGLKQPEVYDQYVRKASKCNLVYPYDLS